MLRQANTLPPDALYCYTQQTDLFPMRSFLSLSLLCALLMAACSLMSCKKSPAQVLEDTEAASFTIYTYDEFGGPMGSGSGFFLSEEGQGLTNFHVLDGAVKAFVKMPDSTVYEVASVLRASQQKDLCLFTVKNPEGRAFPFLPLADAPPQKGEKVYNVGSPLGLENSVSEGIVSSLRQDEHGQVVQTTAPISPGSSGSPLVDEQGEVFALATFQHRSGQNLNFGVVVDEATLSTLDEQAFARKNPRFGQHDRFLLLNRPSDSDPALVLHAIELQERGTVLYFSFTNLNLESDTWSIWCEQHEHFYLQQGGRRLTVTSTTLAPNKAQAQDIKRGGHLRFKAFFPALPNPEGTLEVVWGPQGRNSTFSNISLRDFKDKPRLDELAYAREQALALLEQEEFGPARERLEQLLNHSPSDVIALNALGIACYALDDNHMAIERFTEAIGHAPAQELAYLNRARVYSFQKRDELAAADLSKAIEISPRQPDHYIARAQCYMKMDRMAEAKRDLDLALREPDFRNEWVVYEMRAWACYATNQYEQARQDVQRAYNLTNDPEAEERLVALWNRL